MRAAHLVALLWCLGLCARSPAATQAARAPVKPPALSVADPASEAFYCTWPSEQATLLKPCIDIPLRDVSVCRGHDGWYYLTGTTGYPDWEIRNDLEGLRAADPLEGTLLEDAQELALKLEWNLADFV